MFVGTGSDVGKSIINAAFCRIFKQDGYSPAPFKAQNMSLNSFATSEGLEIGRAQAVQAEAAGIPCSVDMNPILLKPVSNMNAQVVLNGKPLGNKSAQEYFLGTDREFLFNEAMKAFSRLEEKFNPIVIEGAGSISEINLRDKDITNMRVAIEKNADVYLVADIDRGGVFASVYGTIQLLTEEERKKLKGIIINKFRGDIKLFEEGKKMMEELCGLPVVGIVPYYNDIIIEDEDSVVLDKKLRQKQEGKVNIAVVLLRHMSNFTDFNLLEQVTEVNLYYAAHAEEVLEADIVIIPGSKNTIGDLLDLRKRGIAKAILQAHKAGKGVYGICAGFQMMGMEVKDPFHVEGAIESVPGLGILPHTTSLTEEKVTEQCQFYFRNEKELCVGYEIHMGETLLYEKNAVNKLKSGKADGYFLNSKTWGTYIHGIFDNHLIINNIIRENSNFETGSEINYAAFKEEQYDKLAEHVRKNVDLKLVYKNLSR
ncbi:MAG: cobyric acid synthase [Chloroflexia bacterium]|nr:cobyric acid synthase [Chloroflexia bacterium]